MVHDNCLPGAFTGEKALSTSLQVSTCYQQLHNKEILSNSVLFSVGAQQICKPSPEQQVCVDTMTLLLCHSVKASHDSQGS